MESGAQWFKVEETPSKRRKVKALSKGLKGQYNHTVDAKGRLIVPSKLREQLGISFVVTVGLDRCLYAFPNDEWESFESKLRQIPMTNQKGRAFARITLSAAVDCEVDNQGRILLPSNLRDFANITKDVVVAGVGDKAEIWDKAAWESASNYDNININDLAEEFERLGIFI